MEWQVEGLSDQGMVVYDCNLEYECVGERGGCVIVGKSRVSMK